VRFLFDENLSETVLVRLMDLYPGSTHVRRELGDSADDDRVWNHARDHGYVIVTRDQDFSRLSAARGAPPKVVLLLALRPSNVVVESLIRSHASMLAAFAADQEAQIVTIVGSSAEPPRWPAHWKSRKPAR
jgi:predicted nuclease of predicted toxin-antitoxin system